MKEFHLLMSTTNNTQEKQVQDNLLRFQILCLILVLLLHTCNLQNAKMVVLLLWKNLTHLHLEQLFFTKIKDKISIMVVDLLQVLWMKTLYALLKIRWIVKDSNSQQLMKVKIYKKISLAELLDLLHLLQKINHQMFPHFFHKTTKCLASS